MTTLALHPRELDGIESKGAYIVPIVTQEAVDITDAVIAKATENAIRILQEDTIPGSYAKAEAWSERSRKNYFSRKPSTISDEPGAYIKAAAWSERSRKNYFSKKVV